MELLVILFENLEIFGEFGEFDGNILILPLMPFLFFSLFLLKKLDMLFTFF